MIAIGSGHSGGLLFSWNCPRAMKCICMEYFLPHDDTRNNSLKKTSTLI